MTNPSKPGILRRTGRGIVRAWTAVITTGVTEELTNWERKRTRLLNGICFMSVLILATYCLLYSDQRHRLIFWESFVFMVASAVPILLNHRKLHNTAAHVFCIYNLFGYTFLAVSHGQVDAAEYILVASAIASMLFFRKWRIVIIYFILNGVFFALCKYSFTVMEPFLFMPPGEDLYVTNHITLFLIVFLIVLYFKRENSRQEEMLETKNVHLSEEKQKSENLLLNILPAETAEELKETGTSMARTYDRVTVLFSDFQNFTGLAEKVSPQQLVKEMNFYFSAFDDIIHRHNIEKIKTIGDAYMCAGGLPEPNTTNPVDVVGAALEMQAFMAEQKKQRQESQQLFFELRIGIHTGPLVAGIVGTKKFAYDIWGDTVNTASRLENSSEVGRINISGATHELVKDRYRCTYRGKFDVKNKGPVDMYFVDGRLEPASAT